MVTHFQEKVYTALCQVPKGKVTTYQQLAKALGINSSRAVGQALKHNPYAPRVPCHRVVRANGEIGGFNGHTKGHNIRKKISLLNDEGVLVEQGKVSDFDKRLHTF